MRAAKLDRALCVAVLCGGTVVASWSAANNVDPAAPASIVVGAPRGHAVSDRVDALRSGRAAQPLPVAAKERWRVELAGGLDVPPVVDRHGGVIAALVSPAVIRVDARGTQSWRRSLGSAAAVAPPVLASDGAVVVVAGDGKLYKISASGRLRWEIDLGAGTKGQLATPLALDNGGVIVATEHQLVHVASDGSVQARTRLSVRPSGGLLPHAASPGGTLVTGHAGEVWSWRAPAAPRKLGDFGGTLEGGAALISQRFLVAVVDRVNLVALDLLGGPNTVLAKGGLGLAQLEGPVAFDPTHGIVVTSAVGELFAYDARGAMQRRVPIENLALLAADGGVSGFGGMYRRLDLRASPPPLVDGRGTVAFVRHNGRLGVVDAHDSLRVFDPRVCSRPLALLPAGSGAMLVACRSGTLSLWRD